jgi:uncharacterized protein YkwD
MTISSIFRLAPVSRLLGLLVILLGLACWQGVATPAQAEEPRHIYLPLITSAQPPSLSIAEQVVGVTNTYRALHGCGPLTLNPQLTAAANEHSEDMAVHDYFSHTSQDGSSPWDRISRAGYVYSAAAENIAAGYDTAQSVVDGWYNEVPPNDGHRKNILNCALTEVGIGYAENSTSTYQIYWTQDFGSH